MHLDQYHQLTVLVTSGVALFLFAAANLVFRQNRPFICFASQFGITALSVGALRELGSPVELTAGVGGVLGVIMIALPLSTSSLFQAALAWVGAAMRRPAFQSVLLAVGGIALVGLGIERFEFDDEDTINQDNAFLEQAVWRPNLHAEPQTRAITDRGTPVTLQSPDEIRATSEMAGMEYELLEHWEYDRSLIRLRSPDDRTNCHGWVFTNGRYWLPTDQIPKILDDNGYQVVAAPAIGDLAVYYDASGENITHTAIVRMVGGDFPIVESKWGWMGVFLHAPEGSCYGPNFKFFRSARNDHLLAGLGEKSPNPETVPMINVENPANGQ